ncbi:MAG: hypothetical protein OSJ83_11020, partial [Clostridia bacterium]|nr:hypothetical protein [Clostridia bacterium]
MRSADAKKLADTVNVIINNYPQFVVNNLMNLLDTHDTARIISVLGDSGDILWEEALPAELRRHYTVGDVASFTRWYLADYPV